MIANIFYTWCNLFYLPSNRIESFRTKYDGWVNQKHCKLKEIVVSIGERLKHQLPEIHNEYKPNDQTN